MPRKYQIFNNSPTIFLYINLGRLPLRIFFLLLWSKTWKTMQKYTIFFKRFHSVLFFILLIIASCSTPLSKVTYLNGIEPGLTYIAGPVPEEYRIRPNDQLFIQVISDDPLNAAFLNLIDTQRGSIGNASTSMELITYLVDVEGKISYPQLGDIVVADKTVSEVRDIIQSKVDSYLESASVFVKLVNRNITVLGEVKAPGQKLMVKNQLTIFEALGTAGDITDYGNRLNVKLIRELPDGKHVAELNLTDPNIIYSPYYYILPHDIVYVEHSTKVYGAKNLPYSAPISITASVISIGLLILNLF
jgi:polysaccharide biosynthesis/export protein